MKVRGGILPLLAGLDSQAIHFITGTVLPALGVGVLSGLCGTGVQKCPKVAAANGLQTKKPQTFGSRLSAPSSCGYGE